MADSVAIIGAGLTGLMAALHLAQRKLSVTIYDKGSLHEITKKRYTASGQVGRSMSMDISARGFFALETVRCLEQVLDQAVPMTHRIFHERDGSTFELPYGQFENEHILTVSRTHLFNVLLEKCLGCANISVNFEHALASIDFDCRTVKLFDSKNKRIVTINPQLIIGADGTNSAMRPLIETNDIAFQISFFPMSYKELTIPAAYTDGLSINAMHKWARNNAMLVAQPNIDNSFTCAILLPENGHLISFANLNSQGALKEFFEREFPNVLPRMPDLALEYFRNPVGRMKIIRGNSWSRSDFALLLGDAAHGMVPFFGQGVNCCFEDCTILAECIDDYPADWSSILRDFNRKRVADANAINTLSYENYPELFSFEAITQIQLARKIESMLMSTFDSYRSYHNLVCFERVPYTFAQRVKTVQTKLLSRLSERVENIEQIDAIHLKHELAIYQDELALIKGSY